MGDETCGYIVKRLCDRRTIRVGVCTVLEVDVIYPELTCEVGTAGDCTVFNDAYRRMAEAFLYWGENAFGERTVREFEAMGAGAAYSFDRRVLVCSMVAALTEGGSEIRVSRCVRLGRRRGGDDVLLPETVDEWKLPEMTLRVKPRRKPLLRKT